MAEIPNIRIGSDVTIYVTLADGGVKVSWADLEQVTARIYSELRRAVAGPCTVKVSAEDPYTLDVLYEAGRPQYTGIQRLIVSGIYRGVHKTYDAVVCNFVATTEEAVGTIEVELADYTAEGTAGITVTDIGTSVLEGAIRDAKAATVSANQAAADAVALDKEVAANEEQRKANEDERKSNEDTRKANETTRKSAETIRKNNEVKRGESEEARALAEEERRKAEEARAAAELERAAAETKRGESESARELAEQERKEAEEGRKEAETAREVKASETIAQVKSDTAAAIEKADAATEGATTATSNANVATTAAQTATGEAKTATMDANAAAKAATEAKEAIEQDTAVVKTTAQELTDEQAAQARENIGAGRQTDVAQAQSDIAAGQIDVAKVIAQIDRLINLLFTNLGDLKVESISARHLPMVCGFPMVLYGAGVPSASVVPDNWDEETMGLWTGIPCFVGQVYINTNASSGGHYDAVNVTAVSGWKQA